MDPFLIIYLAKEDRLKKNRKFKPVIHRLEYLGFRVVLLLLRLIPERFLYFFGRGIGIFAYHFLRIRRTETMANLRLALGDTLNEAELTHTAREAYANVALSFMEALLLPRFKGRFKDLIDLSGWELVDKNIKKGRGLIVVTAHLGNWEWGGAVFSATGNPFTVVVARQTNPFVDLAINAVRQACGMKVIPLGPASIKYLIQTLQQKEAVGLVADQSAGRKGVLVKFFGRWASTPPGPARLALRYGVPIVVAVLVRTGRFHFQSIFREVEVRDGDTVESVTQRFTTVLEEMVRQHPDQYFWMHRRWKTRRLARPGSMDTTDQEVQEDQGSTPAWQDK